MLNIKLTPFTHLQTNRLELREITAADTDALHALRTNEQAMQYINKEEQTRDVIVEMIARFDSNLQSGNAIMWGIYLKGDTTLIGTVCIWNIDAYHHRGELGYMLHPDHWRKGLLSEVMQVVLDYGFKTLKLHSMEAIIAPENEASRKLVEKFGFVQEAYFRENFYFRGKFLDSVVYSKLTDVPGN